MSRLINEVKEWNTPIVGAYLLWHFTQGYIEKRKYEDAPIVILHFIANAILTNDILCEQISNKRANLESYIRSFTEKKKSDLLACIQQRIIEKRSNTMNAIDIAVSSGLLAWETENATLHAIRDLKQKRRGYKISTIIQKRANQAQILGKWFAEHELFSITSYLGVVL